MFRFGYDNVLILQRHIVQFRVKVLLKVPTEVTNYTNNRKCITCTHSKKKNNRQKKINK